MNLGCNLVIAMRVGVSEDPQTPGTVTNSYRAVQDTQTRHVNNFHKSLPSEPLVETLVKDGP